MWLHRLPAVRIYIQQQRRNASKLPKGYAVVKLGPQQDGTWVLGGGITISRNGEQLNPKETSSIWNSHLYDGPGIAPQNTACDIPLPLSTEPLKNLILHIRDNLSHNFHPALMTMGSFAMALHYQTILSQFFFCPVPLAFGVSGTGKTTAFVGYQLWLCILIDSTPKARSKSTVS